MTNFDPYYSVKIESGVVVHQGPARRLEVPTNISPEERVVLPELLTEIKSIEIGETALMRGSFMDADLAFADSAIFNEIGEFEQTRQENAHGLVFGQLILDGAFGEERAEFAALKPFDTPKGVAHELAVAYYFMGVGHSHNFNTFQPLGVTRLDNGQYALLTKYEHGVKSQDNIFWNPKHESSTTVQHRSLGRIATVLASMHAAGWTHGDAQVKNFFSSNFDELFIADLESMKPFPQRNGTIQEFATNEAINDDLNTLFASLDARSSLQRDHELGVGTIFSFIYTSITRDRHSLVPESAHKEPSEIADIYRHSTNT